MKLQLLAASALAGAALAGAAHAVSISTLAPDGVWHYQDQAMSQGDQFNSGFISGYNGGVEITDWAVISDQFAVYVNGYLRLTTPAVKNWIALGNASPFDPPYTTDASTAYHSGFYSAGHIHVTPGDIITFRDISIPPLGVGQGPFPDGTIAVRGAIPEPASWALMIVGMGALGASLRARRRLAAAA